jgi:hypothetical protein
MSYNNQCVKNYSQKEKFVEINKRGHSGWNGSVSIWRDSKFKEYVT